MEKILITGATGQYGKAVIEALLKLGVKKQQLYAMARDAEKIGHLEKAGVNIVYGDYDDYESLLWAFSDVDKLLFVSSSKITNRGAQHKVVKAAKRAGVKHIVYTSQLHKTDREDSPIKSIINSHLETENAIRKSGIQYTILRNGLYMDFLPAFLGKDVLQKGIFLPAGNGRVAFTLRSDLAEATANILVSSSHKNKIYNLSNDSVTFTEIANMLTEISGKGVTYINANFDRYIDITAIGDTPCKMVLMLAGFAAAAAEGELDGESGQLEALLVRNPKSISEFLIDKYSSVV